MSWDALRVAATDRASGSSVIATRAAHAFARIAATLSEDAIVSAGQILVRGQPIMVACLRLVDALQACGIQASVIPDGIDQERPMRDQRVAASRSSLSDQSASGFASDALTPAARSGRGGSLSLRRRSSAISGERSHSAAARAA
jgi:hypothetical protein